MILPRPSAPTLAAPLWPLALATSLVFATMQAHACGPGDVCGVDGGDGIAGSAAAAGAGGTPGSALQDNTGGDGGALSANSGNPGMPGGNPAAAIDPAVDSGGDGGTFARQSIGGAGGIQATEFTDGAGGEGTSVTVNFGAVGAGGGGGAGGGWSNGCLGGGGGGGGGGGYFEFGVDNPIGGGAGGGGGGGIGSVVTGTVSNEAGLFGGNGGDGGDGIVTFSSGTGGGGGGGGGCAAIVMAGATLSNAGSGLVVGGDGGSIVMAPLAAPGGSGGGGTAVLLAAGTLANAGAIAGGDGGSGRGGYFSGNGGIGVLATGGATLVTSGHIEGGWRIDEGANDIRSEAVAFRGGGNRLVLETGATFAGTVSSWRETGEADDVLVLGGDADGSFDLAQVSAYAWPSTAQFQGFDTFEKSGDGTWTISGSGSTGITPDWTVRAGTLVVESTLPASGPGREGTVRVEGGTLAGTGQAWTTTVVAGGTLMPGRADAPYGTLGVAGDAGFEPGSLLLVRTDGNGACAALVVDGTLALGGALHLHFDAAPVPGMSCVVASAGTALSGSFGSIDAGVVGVEIDYSVHDATITVTDVDTDAIFADGFEAAGTMR